MLEDGLPFIDLDPIASQQFLRDQPKNNRRRNLPNDYPTLVLNEELIAQIGPSKKETWIYDAVCRNLALRCRPCGSISYYLLDCDDYDDYNDKDGPMVRRPLGSVKDYTVSEARIWVQKMVDRKSYFEHLPIKRSILKATPIADLIQLYITARCTDDSIRYANKNTLAAIESLLVEHVAPRFGRIQVSKVKRLQWLLLIEKVRLRRTSRGIHLHKALKTFLNWCVSQGLLEGNPIARTATENPFQKDRKNLHLEDLCAIYGACLEMFHRPASSIIALIILTGEPLKWVRVARYEAVNWQQQAWAIEYWVDYKTVRGSREIILSNQAYQIVENLHVESGFLFKSPRNPDAPINISKEFMHELRERSGIKGEWGAREVKVAARRYIDDPQKSDGNLKTWGSYFVTSFEETRNPIDDGVEL